MNDTPATNDPWNSLLNAGSDSGLWFFLGGPFLLLVLIGISYSVVVFYRRRREYQKFVKDVEEAEDPNIIPLPTARDLVGAKEKPVKPYLVPESLSGNRPDKSPDKAPDKSPDKSLNKIEDLRLTDAESWRERLFRGLGKTREVLRGQLQKIFAAPVALDDGVLEALHEALYRADVGVGTTDTLVAHVKSTLRKQDKPSEAVSWEAVAACLSDKAQEILARVQDKPLNFPPQGTPCVILIVGVNGVGKTTTIGKLSAHFIANDKKVLIAAADTFRAAAVEQLNVWGERLGVEVIKHQAGGDPAAVAYDGVKASMARGADILLIDTAGRLHAKADLMAELGKINRVIGKDLPGAPHETWLVIDATTGQNAVQQVKAFREVVPLSGLIVTKLDGTAKGGVLVGIADQFGLPIRFVGVGEKASDLRPFQASDYAKSLF